MKTSLAGLFSEKCPQKELRPSWKKKYKAEKYPRGALRPFWNKEKKLKIVLKKRYGLIGSGHFRMDG